MDERSILSITFNPNTVPSRFKKGKCDSQFLSNKFDEFDFGKVEFCQVFLGTSTEKSKFTLVVYGTLEFSIITLW